MSAIKPGDFAKIIDAENKADIGLTVEILQPYGAPSRNAWWVTGEREGETFEGWIAEDKLCLVSDCAEKHDEVPA